MRPILSRAMAEFYGTFALVLFGSTAIYMGSFPGGGYGIFGIAVIHAVILSVAISATMGVSGGHLNPAVTIGLAAVKRISPKDAAIYVVSQVAGGILAGWLAKNFFAPHVGYLSGFGTPMLAAGIRPMHGMFLEGLGTFVLMSSVMGTAVAKNAPKIGGFGIGMTLVPVIMIMGAMTGASVNPARFLGPAVNNGISLNWYVYLIGPIVGAVAAAFFWAKISGDE